MVKVVSASNGDSILPFADMFYLITIVLKMMHEERFHNETICLLPQEIFWREGGTVLCLVRCLYTDAYPCSHCWSYSLPLWLCHCWWKHTKVNGTHICKHNLRLHCTHLQKYKTETEALVILSPVSSTSSGLLGGPQYFALWYFGFFCACFPGFLLPLWCDFHQIGTARHRTVHSCYPFTDQNSFVEFLVGDPAALHRVCQRHGQGIKMSQLALRIMILHIDLVNVCSLENKMNCSFLTQETKTLVHPLRTAEMRTWTWPPTQQCVDFYPHQTMNGTGEKGPTSTKNKSYLLLATWTGLTLTLVLLG